VVLETELWPALLFAAHRRGVPILLASARLSDRAFARYRTLGRAFAPLLEGFMVVQAQSEEDARRFRALGAPAGRVTVGGNLKFDLSAPDASDPIVRALRRTRAGGWRVLVAGSTHAGEEEALLEAARGEPLGGMKLGLVLAPRKLERLDEVAGTCARAGVAVRLWSELGEPLEGALLRAFGEGAAVLVDRYGLLGRLYGGGHAAFVGGSLVPVGGHNLLEPLNWGVPVVFGPHTENAREVAEAVLAEGAGTRVADGAGLASALGSYLTDEDARGAARSGAEALFARNRGATARVLAVLESVGALEATA
jgi:3-deoxy-D-manno-octulosonic-acid transferase